MQYYAIYLPAEGAISEGDMVRHNGSIVKALKKEGEGDTWKTSGFPVYGSNLQKVRLFLCTKDIQIGDKIFDTYSGLEIDVTNQNFPSNASDFWVKKIAYISSEAKWVKEGDVFNEDEVRWAWYPPYDEPEYYPLSEFTWPQLVKQRGGYKTVPKYLPPIVAIKCRCCEDFK